MHSLKKFDLEFEMTNRLRVEGTENLIAAARAAGTQRFVAQSYTGWPNARSGARVKTEADPLDANPPKTMSRTLDAIRRLEEMLSSATDLTGVILRYGAFYGPGTGIARGGEIVEAVRRRKFPIIGNGAGVWSWAHIDDCARATHLAAEGGPGGIYNIVDDDPAEVSVWLPCLAQAIGAKPPYRLPEWLGRLAIGDSGVSMMTKIRGSSNAKVKRLLGWQPIYASWRDGFRHGLEGGCAPQKLDPIGKRTS
jgi:nucleoside-diphosphate-sugar epimerase